jgi:hypothetical protein
MTGELHTPGTESDVLPTERVIDALTAAQIAAGETGSRINGLSREYFSPEARKQAAKARDTIGRLATIANSGVRFPDDPPSLPLQ